MHRVSFLGDGVLTCVECGGQIRGESLARGYTSDPLAAFYRCPKCRDVLAPADQVDRELHALARNAWSDSRWVSRWRSTVSRELDAEIAEARAFRTWGQHERHWQFLAHELVWTPDRDLTWYWFTLTEYVAHLVALRATLAFVLGHTPRENAPRWAEFEQVARDYSRLYRDTRRWRRTVPRGFPWYRATRPTLLRALMERPRRPARLAAIEDWLWQSFAEQEWREPDLTVLWENTELLDDRRTARHRNVGRRRWLVSEAVGNGKLVLMPRTTDGPRVRVVSPVRERHTPSPPPERGGRTVCPFRGAFHNSLAERTDEVERHYRSFTAGTSSRFPRRSTRHDVLPSPLF